MEWKTIKWLNLSKNKVSYTNGQKKSYSYMLTFATIILWLELYATINYQVNLNLFSCLLFAIN